MMNFTAFNNVNNASPLSPESLAAQRDMIEWERQQRLNEYRCRMSEAGELSYDNRVVALKLLIHEAHRRDVNFHGPQRANYWERISRDALYDAEEEGTANVQKNLSCMCIFTPQLKNHMRYGENCSERMTRILAQQRILRTIQEQQEFGNGNLFVAA